MKLNTAQREAVSFRDGPCMVLAGPGSGKTTVIAARAAALADFGVPEKHLLTVTFTKAAAEEMRRRYLKLTEKEATNAVFGTFHAVFYAILRDEYHLEAHSVVGEGDKYKLLEETLHETDPAVTDDREFLKSVLQAISTVKNHRLDPETYDAGLRQISFGKVYRIYQEKLKKRGLLDYDDMLTLTLELFQKKPEVLESWRGRFRYIMVDEFQDVNPIQYEIVRLLAAPRNNLFIVGDDDQSIYAFRGARPDLMLGFPKDYPKTRRILLDVNYRSGNEIVKRSLALIDHNRARFQKKLRAEKSGGTVTVREFSTDALEYEAAAEEVVSLLREGVPAEEMALLFRTNGGMTGMIQKLMEKSVPFVTRDRIPNLFAHFVCRPLFACLNYIAGNHTRMNFFKFMNCPWRYFRREDFTEETIDLPALALRYEKDPERAYMAEKVRVLDQQLRFMATLTIPYAMIHYFRNYLGYDRFLSENAEKKNLDAAELMKTLDEIQASAKDYASVEAWYKYVAKYSLELQALEKAEKKTAKGRVTLSTLHGAKGLEYRHVWILDVNERVIPHEKARKPEEIEEERRLLYVGMTRAAEHLSLFHPKNRFGRDTLPSRFLSEF